MPINKDEVKHIANLSKLKLSDDEVEKYSNQLSEILNYMDKLDEIDTENVEPLISPLEDKNRFRKDKAEVKFGKEEALKNAPKKEKNFFTVPKVIDKGKKEK